MRSTYLLCFAHNPVGHSKHYIGSAQHLPTRLRQHRYGTAAALTRELKHRGGSFKCVRQWGGNLESELKAQKNARRLCPLCNPSSYQTQKVKRTVTLRCKRKFARQLARNQSPLAQLPSVASCL
jgi:hypothetical protein